MTGAPPLLPWSEVTVEIEGDGSYDKEKDKKKGPMAARMFGMFTHHLIHVLVKLLSTYSYI